MVYIYEPKIIFPNITYSIILKIAQPTPEGAAVANADIVPSKRQSHPSKASNLAPWLCKIKVY